MPPRGGPRAPSAATLIEFSHRATSGIALLSVVVLVAWTVRATPPRHPARAGAWASLFFMLMEAAVGAGVGSFAGYLGGLLGVGGGNFIVPVLTWLGYDPKVAAGTTGFVVVFASAAGFLGHVSLGGLDPAFLIVTGAAAVVGALVGSWLVRFKLSSAQLKRVIGILLWGIALKIVWGLL